jgi:hypothetical protein
MMISNLCKNYLMGLFLCIAVLGYSITVYGVDESSFNRQEVYSLWNQYLQKMGNMQGDILWSYSKKGDITHDGTKKMYFCYPHVARETLYAGLKGRNKDRRGLTVGVSGKSYQFSLSTDNNEIKSYDEIKNIKDWLVKDVSPITSEQKDISKRLYFPSISENDLISSPNDPIGFGICSDLGKPFLLDEHLYLPPFILQDEFIISKVEKITHKGNEFGDMIRVVFSFYSRDEKKYPTLIVDGQPFFKMEGELILSTKFYLITKGQIACYYGDFKKTISIDCKYSVDAESFPLPISYTSTQTLFDGSSFVMQFSFENLRPTNPKDIKRFTLSHYGLREPDFGDQLVSRSRYIIIVLGLLLIGLGLLSAIIKRMKRRAESKNDAK